MKTQKMKTRLLVPMMMAGVLVALVATSCQKEDTDEDTDPDSNELVINNYKQVATGQVIAYDTDGEVVAGLIEGDALYGQDANYLNGETMAYQDDDDEKKCIDGVYNCGMCNVQRYGS